MSRAPHHLPSGIELHILNYIPPAPALPYLPVMSWNGLVEISCPAAATPMMHDSPHPLWAASRAARMTPVFPVASKV